MEYVTDYVFPTALVYTKEPRPVTQDEFNFVKTCADDIFYNKANCFSKNNYVLNEPELKDLREFILSSIKIYVDTIINPKENLDFYITQSWLNYTNRGGNHHIHNHPNSIISGVYYFNANPDVDKIKFHNQTYEQILISPKEYNKFNGNEWWFPVETGKLIMFPSRLHHSVEQVVNEETRISLAFNVFVKGNLGSEQRLTALHL
jgi:uncharacterized protein (TIGR02466 family)